MWSTRDLQYSWPSTGALPSPPPDATISESYIDSEDLGFSGYFNDSEYTAVTGKAWRGRNMMALDVAARKVMAHLGVDAGVNLKVRSMIPIAVGLGSSAAVCASRPRRPVGELFEGNLTKEKIAELSFEGEKVIHGNPSGADNSVATYGGIMWSRARRRPRGGSELDAPPPIHLSATRGGKRSDYVKHGRGRKGTQGQESQRSSTPSSTRWRGYRRLA